MQGTQIEVRRGWVEIFFVGYNHHHMIFGVVKTHSRKMYREIKEQKKPLPYP